MAPPFSSGSSSLFSTAHLEVSTRRESRLDRADLAAMALLAGSVVAMFSNVVFTRAMFFFRDVSSYSYPHARLIAEACRQGYLPYWNPYLNFGEPLLANPNFLFFYPSTLFLILLPVDFAYTMHYVGHFALAAVGIYWLARRWGQSRAASFFAAFVFVFSGPVLSLGNLYNHVACAAWIPWALLLTDHAVENGSRRPWILLTLVFALQFLAAEPFTLLTTLGLAVAYALHRNRILRAPRAASSRRILVNFLWVAGFTVALCAIQFFPSLDLLQNSRRGLQGLPYRETTYWSFHPLLLLEVVLPGFFGPAFSAPTIWTRVLNCHNAPYFVSVFVGFVPLFFALVGWALGRDQRRKFAAGAVVTLLLLSSGRFTPLFALAYLLIPPLQLVRFPVKLLVPAVLLIALLAGWGFDTLRQFGGNMGGRRAQVLLPLKCLLACTTLVWIVCLVAPRWVGASAAWILVRTSEMFIRSPAGELSSAEILTATDYLLALLRLYLPGLAGFALGGLVWMLAFERKKVWARGAVPVMALLGLAQLVTVNSRANPTVPKDFYTYRPPVLSYFQDSTLPYRFCYISRSPVPQPGSLPAQAFLNFESIPEAAGFTPLAQTAFRERLLLARGSSLARVDGISNLDVDWSFPPFLYEFWMFARLQIPDTEQLDYLLGRANVRYQILSRRQDNATRREVAPIFNGSSEPSYLYENLQVVPRAYAVGSALYSPDPIETLTRLSAPDFDAVRVVVLAAGAEIVPLSDGPAVAGKVEIVERRPNAVTLQAELSRPSYVVLLDRFDPNWHATVDGREAPLARANHLFRAVRVEAGKHQVRFYYRQRGLRAGLAVSLVALVVLVTLYLLDPHRFPSHPDMTSEA